MLAAFRERKEWSANNKRLLIINVIMNIQLFILRVCDTRIFWENMNKAGIISKITEKQKKITKNVSYIDDGFTCLRHVSYDAIGQYEQNEVIGTSWTRWRRNAAS